jgi:hypothetical protein
MSNNLLSGFEDVLSRYNLCPNGAFRINQRGTFNNDLVDAKVGDFLCDMWSISISTVDYLQACNGTAVSPSSGLRFKGRGKKGQYVRVSNRDATAYNYMRGGILFNAYQRDPLTAAAVFQNAAGSVPIVANVQPRYATASYTLIYYPDWLVLPGVSRQAVMAMVSDFYNINSPAFFQFILQADGDFDVTVRDFVELAGAFRNPPTTCPVPYAEDLQRCERYYTAGFYHVKSRANQINTGDAQFLDTIEFPVTMAGAPSAALDAVSVSAYDGAGGTVDRSSQQNGSTRYVTTSGVYTAEFMPILRWAEATYAANMYNFGFDLSFNWSASV